MKNTLRFIIVISAFISSAAEAQTGDWTWINGDSIYNSTGSYGLQGVPSATNKPPALYEPIEWIDNQGKLWMYGGYGTANSSYADLWKFDPTTNEWAWMKGPGTPNFAGNFGVQGVDDPANNPPSKYCANSWVDNAGKFWMFGGYNLTTQLYDDMWKFDPVTNNWTWMKGSNVVSQLPVYGVQGIPDPANTPGSRYESTASWIDNTNNLWFFGGTITANFGLATDMWKYDIGTNQWTFMNGSPVLNLQGNYGIKGVAAVSNLPGSRQAYSKWKDANGNFWLFGGLGYDADSLRGNLNDLWKYDVATNIWTWMNGSDTVDQPGVYGSLQIPSATNIPPSRLEQRSTFTDACGNFWLFAGISYFTSAPIKFYNDLWKYDLTSGLWTWMTGDSISDQFANWGSLNVTSPTNKPGSRSGSVVWYTGDSTFYIFGGFFVSTTTKLLNDLWKFEFDTICITNPIIPVAQFQISDSIICTGSCLNLTDASLNNPTYWQWNITGPQSYSFNQQNVSNFCPSQSGNYAVSLIVCNSFSCDTTLVSNAIQVDTILAVNLGNDTLICSGTSLQLDAGAGYSGYLWSTSETTSQISVSLAGSYSVIVQSGACFSTDTIIVTKQSCSAPLTQFAVSDTSFCEKQCIDFFDLSTNNPTSWQWFFPGADSTTSTLQNPTGICYNSYGSFDVTLVTCNSFGCDTLVITNFISEFINPVNIVYQSNDTLYSLPFISYQWYEVTGGLIPGATNQYYVFTVPGSYFCIAIDSIGCIATSNTITNTVLMEISSGLSLQLFPDPNNGSFIVNWNKNIQGNGTLKIYDAPGKLVYEINVEGKQMEASLKLSLESGIYLIELTFGDKKVQHKFVVSKN